MSGRMTRRNSLLSGLGLAIAGKVVGTPASSQAESELAPSLDGALSLNEIESLARLRMQHNVYEVINGAAADEITMRWNREALNRIRVRPRVLVDVSKIDTRINLLGQELPFPILLAPTGAHWLVHPEAELATVRGAG